MTASITPSIAPSMTPIAAPRTTARERRQSSCMASRTTSGIAAPAMQPSSGRLGLPPPLTLDLVDVDRKVGWIVGDLIGFLGFAREGEAAIAGWIMYRALARRLARTHRMRPVPIGTPIDAATLAVRRAEDRHFVLLAGRPIAVVIPPAADSADGADSFGVTVRVPPPVDEIRMRAMAYRMYRSLRRSGVAWALWRTDRGASTAIRTVERSLQRARAHDVHDGATVIEAARPRSAIEGVSEEVQDWTAEVALCKG
jgi:hypothetical protein